MKTYQTWLVLELWDDDTDEKETIESTLIGTHEGETEGTRLWAFMQNLTLKAKDSLHYLFGLVYE